MNEATWQALLQQWGQALDRFGEALARDPTDDLLVLDGTMQRFEFSFELAWKVMQKRFDAEGMTLASPKAVLRRAFLAGWLEEEGVWLAMLSDRNQTVHTYREEKAWEIHGRLPRYHQALQALHGRLSQLEGFS